MSILGRARQRLAQSGYQFPSTDPYGHYETPSSSNLLATGISTGAPGFTTYTPPPVIEEVQEVTPRLNPSPTDDQRSYDVYHRPTPGTGNPVEDLRGIFNTLRDIDWSQEGEEIRDQLREAAGGYRDLFSGGLSGALNLTGEPRTDAFYQAPGYAERYLQPQMDDIAAGELRVGPGGGVIHQPEEGGRGRETTVADRQALILAGQDAYYDEHGNVRPRAEREERGIVTLPGHFEEGSAAGGTSAVGQDLVNIANNLNPSPSVPGPVVPSGPTPEEVAAANAEAQRQRDEAIAQRRAQEAAAARAAQHARDQREAERNQRDRQSQTSFSGNLRQGGQGIHRWEGGKIDSTKAAQMFSDAIKRGASDDELDEIAYMSMGGFPGEPRGTDTVPTWLSEGEFVVDRDSAKQFGPLLEKINNWEPNSGMDGFMSDMDNLINRYNGV